MIMNMIRAYQLVGHEAASLDPLNLDDTDQHGTHMKTQLHKLDHKYWGFTDADLDREFYLDSPQFSGLLGMKKNWKLGEIMDALKSAYSDKIGVEFMHISDTEKCNWIRDKLEGSVYAVSYTHLTLPTIYSV